MNIIIQTDRKIDRQATRTSRLYGARSGLPNYMTCLGKPDMSAWRQDGGWQRFDTMCAVFLVLSMQWHRTLCSGLS